MSWEIRTLFLSVAVIVYHPFDPGPPQSLPVHVLPPHPIPEPSPHGPQPEQEEALAVQLENCEQRLEYCEDAVA